jgi:DNA-binding Xre family transcriptional regulator
MTTLTWRVAELAARRGWSTRHLAKASGLDEKTVRNILAGRATRVDLETIARLSSTLEVTPGALWMSRPDPADAWARSAGAAGRAEADELARIVADQRSEYVDSGLERALRSP